MNRQELEKMFDSIFKQEICLSCEIFKNNKEKNVLVSQDIKDFIFKTVIPEVLKSVLPEKPIGELINFKEDNYNGGFFGYRDAIDDAKKKAKALYRVEL